MSRTRIQGKPAGLIFSCFAALLLGMSGAAGAACSAWIDRAYLNEYYFGNGTNFLEIFSQDPAFSSATWANWSIDVYDGQNSKKTYSATQNTSTQQTCTSGSKDWGLLNVIGGLEASHALVVLRDGSGAPVDAMAFDNTKPPDPWKSNTENYYPNLVNECPTLSTRLSAQAAAAAAATKPPYNAANMTVLSSYGNKDVARFPDGTGNWSESALSGSNTTSTPCRPNSPVLVKTATSGATVTPGNTITWTVKLANTGPSDLTSRMAILDTISSSSGAPKLTNVTALPSSGCGFTTSFASAGGTWYIASLAKGASCTLTVTATVPSTATAGQTYTNSVSGSIGGYMQTDSSTVVVSTQSIDHYEIDIPNVGLTCQESSIVVRACANSTTPCTSNMATTATSATLAASTTPLVSGATFTNTGGATQSFTGSATYAFSAASPTTVAVSLAAPTGAAVTCYALDGTTRTPAPGCSYDVKKAIFQFSVPNFKAGNGSGAVAITALREDDATKKCVSFTPSGGVKFWTTYSDPNSGTKNVSMTVGSTSYTLPTSKPAGGNIPLAFDAAGTANFSLDYLDAGRLQLDAEWNSITGYSRFVVKPYFTVSGLTCQDTVGTANPAATSATGARFCRAGQKFSATVSAVAKDGTTPTPNFGNESTPEGAKLAASLVAPAGGTSPALNGSFGSFATVSGGSRQASGNNFSWDEVGIIQLTPGIADGDYLNAGDVTDYVVPYVGRFFPDHFETTATPGCGAFTYSGQPFSVTTTAYKQGGSGTTGITTNYAGAAWARDAAIAPWSGSPLVAVPTATGTLANGTYLATNFTGGSATASNVQFTFANIQTPPLSMTLRATETSGTDNVTSNGASEASTPLWSGRLWMANAYGSELLPLPVPMQLQFWSTSGWSRNVADTCTTLVTPDNTNGGLVFAAASPRNQLSAGETTASLTNPAAAGDPKFRLSKPGAGNYGFVDIVGSILRGTSTWLVLPTPTARACFGVCGPRNPVIYQRENY